MTDDKNTKKLYPTDVLNLQDKLSDRDLEEWYKVALVTFIDEEGKETFKRLAVKKD